MTRVHEVRITENEDGSYRLDPRRRDEGPAGRAITSVLGVNLEQAVNDVFERGPIPEPEWHEEFPNA